MSVIAFDFETAPDDPYRRENRATLNPHKAHIVDISFSVTEGDATYVPIAHRIGANAEPPTEIWQWLADNVFMNTNIVKVAHNLAFESAFLYVHGIILQEPCYDTIAAAQLVYKNETEFRGLDDSGLKTLAKDLINEHLPSYEDTVGNRHFDKLDSTTYNGYYVFGKSKADSMGLAKRTNSDTWIYSKEQVKDIVIIDDETWEKARKSRENNKKFSRSRIY